MRSVADKICREKQNTRFMFNYFFFKKNHAVYETVEKYSRTGQGTDDDMAHARCVLDT